ncbi:PorP/SprF family type IX secretion system membrane protein [Chitinophaga japonensis]|uniref:Type IX secretion system PorP/SprF family membrane protein n=1 Tax=Chitinophaga japonensis TaxID=104662 RepID=A0A562SZM0_CHIJA|nr:PorP/SprF family type IX secretion system membrane protein [Chitinophaga japonensis]TWI86711.1 type IX secretion system PorP/SprF family membrane protein [Chitinophaga japonensis]
MNQLKLNRTYMRFICCLLLAAGCISQGMAQGLSDAPALLEPSGTQWFQNQYLANPAMAGIDTGLHLNAAYRRQWSGVEGAPRTAFFTADGLVGKRVGAGLHIFNDQAGLIDRTRVALSYAYHLPLGNRGQQLHFGLSLALNVQRLDYSHVDGDITDPSLAGFNRRDNYFEAEYGMAYTDGRWTLQGALPNIRTLFTGDDKGVNGGGIFFTAASYRFTLPGAISRIEPKVAYRGVKGYDNILDAGLQVGFLDNVASVMGMYHTSKSVTAGLGVNIAKTVLIQALYTTQTGGIKTYVDGAYEVGATVNLFR